MTTRRPGWAAPALVFLVMLLIPQDAFAFWGWIERLSGPGPYWGFQFPFDRLVCIPKGERLPSTTRFGSGTENLACAADRDIRAYLSVEVSRANSKADDRFPAVAFTGVKPIFFYRVPGDTVDVGAGVGGTRFSGKDFAFWRWSAPVRARIFAPGLPAGSRWRGIHLALQADYFPMEFTSADFLIPPGYQSHHRWVPSIFLSVDVLRLVQ